MAIKAFVTNPYTDLAVVSVTEFDLSIEFRVFDTATGASYNFTTMVRLEWDNTPAQIRVTIAAAVRAKAAIEGFTLMANDTLLLALDKA